MLPNDFPGPINDWHICWASVCKGTKGAAGLSGQEDSLC
jgi:hypothetical protein